LLLYFPPFSTTLSRIGGRESFYSPPEGKFFPVETVSIGPFFFRGLLSFSGPFPTVAFQRIDLLWTTFLRREVSRLFLRTSAFLPPARNGWFPGLSSSLFWTAKNYTFPPCLPALPGPRGPFSPYGRGRSPFFLAVSMMVEPFSGKAFLFARIGDLQRNLLVGPAVQSR